MYCNPKKNHICIILFLFNRINHLLNQNSFSPVGILAARRWFVCKFSFEKFRAKTHQNYTKIINSQLAKASKFLSLLFSCKNASVLYENFKFKNLQQTFTFSSSFFRAKTGDNYTKITFGKTLRAQKNLLCSRFLFV